MPGLVRLPAGVLKGGAALAGLYLAGQPVWQKPAPIADGEITDFYGIGAGQIPMDHIYAAAPVSNGYVSNVPNAAGAGPAFNLTPFGQIALDEDGAQMTPTVSFTLANIASLLGTRLMIVADINGFAAHQYLAGRNDSGVMSNVIILSGGETLRVNRNDGTGWVIVDIPLNAPISPGRSIYEIEFSETAISVFVDGQLRGSRPNPYTVYDVRRICAGQSTSGGINGELLRTLSIIRGGDYEARVLRIRQELRDLYFAPPITYLREGTVTDPSLAVSLGPFAQRGPRPYVNQFKMSEPWRASNTGGGNTEYAALVSAGTITQEGQINTVPAGLDNITTRLLEFLMPDMGCGPRWTLMWDGEGSAYIQGGQNVVESPGRIDFDFTANGQNFINLLVTGVTNGPLRNFRLVNELDTEAYEAGLTFRPAYVDEVRNFRALRFDNWVNIVENQTTTWASRCTPAYETYRAGFAPLEHCVDLCNLIGADMWFCHPYRVTDDYVAQAAELVRDRLDANRHVWVEYAQKCWDFATPQAHYCREQGDLMFGTGGPQDGENYMEWYGVRSAQVARIWRNAWGAISRLHTVFQTHTDWEGLEAIGLDAPRYVAMDDANQSPSTAFTDYAVHSQIDGGMAYGEAYETVEGWRTTLTETEVFDRIRDQSLTAAHFPIPGGRYVDNMIVTWNYHHQVADSYGLSVICYDGGTHIHGGGAAMSNGAHTAMLNRYHYSPQFAEVVQAMLEGWRDTGGGLFSFSVHSRVPESTITVGLRRYEGDVTPALTTVETWNATHAGPAGRGAEDFVGPQDRTADAPTEPPPPSSTVFAVTEGGTADTTISEDGRVATLTKGGSAMWEADPTRLDFDPIYAQRATFAVADEDSEAENFLLGLIVRLDAIDGPRCLMSRNGLDSNTQRQSQFRNNGGLLQFVAHAYGGGATTLSSASAVLSTGQWAMLTMRGTLTTGTVRLNGVDVGTGDISTMNRNIAMRGVSMIVGARYNPSAGGHADALDGDVLVWDAQFNATDMAAFEASLLEVATQKNVIIPGLNGPEPEPEPEPTTSSNVFVDSTKDGFVIQG